MEIKELVSGIVVIIDDEVNSEGTDIYKIRQNLANNHMPIVAYEQIPEMEDIQALSHAAFIILDWNFNKFMQEDTGERLMIPELTRDNTERLIAFLKAIRMEIFVPLFIFTSLSPEEVENTLREEKLLRNDGNPDMIFVKQKTDILSEEDLFDTIGQWMIKMPSVYVLKAWEKIANEAKTNMFLEWYNLSPNWVPVIWELLKKDSIENDYEFGTFITRNVVNRMQAFEFDKKYFQNEDDNIGDTTIELKRILEGERYQQYDTEHLPKQAYTGDLIKMDGNKYYLNVRAQCDISRNSENSGYNPKLYCIKGKQLKKTEIALRDIELGKNENLVFSNGKEISLTELREICKDSERLADVNKKFKKNRNNTTFYHRGELLEKKHEAIIACVDGGKCIRFELKEMEIFDFDSVKDKRIGRILSPYIDKIQSKFSQYIVREGVTPLPEEALRE